MHISSTEEWQHGRAAKSGAPGYILQAMKMHLDETRLHCPKFVGIAADNNIQTAYLSHKEVNATTHEKILTLTADNSVTDAPVAQGTALDWNGGRDLQSKRM